MNVKQLIDAVASGKPVNTVFETEDYTPDLVRDIRSITKFVLKYLDAIESRKIDLDIDAISKIHEKIVDINDIIGYSSAGQASNALAKMGITTEI